MKVQTSDDGKMNNDEKADASTTSAPPYTIDYEIRPSPQAKYINLSKLVLLILAIIATFLACLVFARDLWGQKNVDKPEVHHHAPRVMGPASHNRFPLEDFMDGIPDPFDMMGNDKNDEEPHLVKTTKITFKVMPTDGEDFPPIPLGMKKVGFGGPQMNDGFMDDVLKTMMGLMNRPEERKPTFGDLPFFGGPNNARPIHPKLIIFRKFSPPQEDGSRDAIKDFLSSLNNPHPAEKYRRPMEPFPMFPIIKPIQRTDVPDGSDSLLSKIIKDFGLVGPLGRIVIKKKPLSTPKTETTGPEGWKKYKGLVSKLAQEVDHILDTTSSLKQTVMDELNKIKDENSSSPEAAAEEDTNPKPENPAKEFLSNALESLIKISDCLTAGSIVIKTEDGAMDLINKSDKKSLVNTIQSFLKELNGPLGDLFSTSTVLTKTAGKDGVSPPVLQGIVGLATDIVDFGKLIYEDMAKIASSVSESPVPVTPPVSIPSPPAEPVVEPKANPEPAQQATDAPTSEPEKKADEVDSAEPAEAVLPQANLFQE